MSYTNVNHGATSATFANIDNIEDRLRISSSLQDKKIGDKVIKIQRAELTLSRPWTILDNTCTCSIGSGMKSVKISFSAPLGDQAIDADIDVAIAALKKAKADYRLLKGFIPSANAVFETTAVSG